MTEFRQEGQWGHTNNPLQIVVAEQYLAAMRQDGWIVEPLYDTEPRASAKCTKDGWMCHWLARCEVNGGKPKAWVAECAITFWGPDGLVVRTPPLYSWDALLAALRTCNACGATNVETQRYSFAGRCCASCLPAMRAKHERPGWAD